MKLYTKITLLIIFIAFSIGLFCSVMANRIMRNALNAEQIKKSQILALSIADNITSKVIDNEVITAKEMLQKITSSNAEVDYAYIIGFDEKIFAHSFSEGFPRDFADRARGIYVFDKQPITKYITSAGPVLDVAHPLIKGMDAHIHIGINQTRSQNQLMTLQSRLLIITFTVALFGILFGVFLARRITYPFKLLADSMRAFGEGKDEDNIVNFLDRMEYYPAYKSSKNSGDGFKEIIERGSRAQLSPNSDFISFIDSGSGSSNVVCRLS